MDLKPYIESGILELYVLDQLSAQERVGVERMLKVYEALQKEVLAIEIALENLAMANAIKPSAKVKGNVVNAIKKLKKTKPLALSNLPIIDEHTDYLAWLPLANDYKKAELADGVFTKMLQHSEKIVQMLIISETDVPEEIHEDEHESFLILEGQCNCIINGKSRLMGPGDFMAIPLHEPHNVVLVTPKVTAILQRLKVG